MRSLYCVKSLRIRSYSGPHFSARLQSECGKIRTRITLNTDARLIELHFPLLDIHAKQFYHLHS